MKTNFRNAITIPEKSWSRFRDIFTDYVDKIRQGASTTDRPTTSATSSSGVGGRGETTASAVPGVPAIATAPPPPQSS